MDMLKSKSEDLWHPCQAASVCLGALVSQSEKHHFSSQTEVSSEVPEKLH